ncbi:MAG: hypothetical protein COB17_04750 [Sulfurimonas sp.]|nr:MAG: hypothetical protein COB17_04750 [Sulfurimonas sp.]
MFKFLFMILLFFNLSADKLGMYEHQGNFVDLDLIFLDEKDKEVSLKELMQNKPTIITLNYYRCAGLCSPQLNSLASTLDKMELDETKDYKVITISFAVEDTSALAAQKKKNILSSMKRPFNPDAWSFLTGSQTSINSIVETVGFHYEKTVSKKGSIDYIHPAAMVIISPKGKITRYLNGIDQLPFDVQLALIEASDGRVGPTIAKTLLYCFSYDPKNKTYVFAFEKLFAVIMLLSVAWLLFYLIKHGRKKDEY